MAPSWSIPRGRRSFSPQSASTPESGRCRFEVHNHATVTEPSWTWRHEHLARYRLVVSVDWRVEESPNVDLGEAVSLLAPPSVKSVVEITDTYVADGLTRVVEARMRIDHPPDGVVTTWTSTPTGPTVEARGDRPSLRARRLPPGQARRRRSESENGTWPPIAGRPEDWSRSTPVPRIGPAAATGVDVVKLSSSVALQATVAAMQPLQRPPARGQPLSRPDDRAASTGSSATTASTPPK